MNPLPGHEPETFVFLLVPGLSLMSLASAIEPLRSLNRLAGRTAYAWRLASLHGGQVTASNGSRPSPAAKRWTAPITSSCAGA